MINLVVGEDVVAVNETVWKNILARAKSLPNPVVEYKQNDQSFRKTKNIAPDLHTLYKVYLIY